jgi:hypothetical protein
MGRRRWFGADAGRRQTAPHLKALRRSAAPLTGSEPVIQRDWLTMPTRSRYGEQCNRHGLRRGQQRRAKPSDVAGDVAGAVSDAAGAAADAVKGLLNSAINTLTSAFNAVVGKIGGAWDSVKTGVTNAAETAMQGAVGFLGGLGRSSARLPRPRLLDVGVLKTAWAAVTGAAEAVAGVRGIVATVARLMGCGPA